MDRTDVARWMQRALLFDRGDYDDCGDIDCTRLAEAAAAEFGLYDEDDESTIPEWVFDLSFAVSERA